MLGKALFLRLELVLLAGFERGLPDLVDREGKELHLLGAIPLGSIHLLPEFPLRRERGVPGGERGDLFPETRVGIEETAMLVNLQKGLMIVLAVDVNEKFGELGELGPGYRRVLDPRRALAVRAKGSSEKDAIAVRLDAAFGEPGAGHGSVLLEIHGSRHARFLRPGPDGIGSGLAAEKEGQRADEDGFSRARLARKDVEPGPEFERNRVDEGEILDGQVFKHGIPRFARSLTRRSARALPTN